MSGKVSLVLSSGGARGLAHIGVIEGLEAAGYTITSVAGSSIGAVIGAFYACGELESYKQWAMEIDQWTVFKLMDFTLSAQGFIRGEKVFKALESLIPDRKIQDLDIPFAAVATDIQKGKEVVFKKGSMYRALKASASIPTVVKPLRHKGRELIDGGVMTPIPVEFIKRKKGDLLVVSNVNAGGRYPKRVSGADLEDQNQNTYFRQLNGFRNALEKLLPANNAAVTKKMGYLDLLTRTVDLMQDKMTNLLMEKHKPDLVINIPRNACGVFDFNKAKEMIDIGREEFDKAFATSKMSK